MVITFTRLTGPNAVVSGLFFDPPPPLTSASASFVGTNTAVQGNWQGVYGAQGYDIVNGPVSLPSYASVIPAGQSLYTWAATSSDPRALQIPGSNNRVAATWYASTSFTIATNLSDGQAHDIALYCSIGKIAAAASGSRSRASEGTILDTRTISNFSGGAYLQWTVTGNVIITVTRLTGPNAVVSGLFFDAPSPVISASASFIGTNTSAQGNWQGVYGAQGYDIVTGAVSLPSYATVAPAEERTYIWAATSSDPRALETPDGTNRIAACWYSSTTFSIALNLTDGQVARHRFLPARLGQ